ncbi:hypothetical protein ABZ695_02730 [Streptomyces sp. NPDC006976]|uniref:Uncharacterized protein n=1 Tax=Streptomyces castrisilvae TaxID=3033811 RepID=A0ABY9HJX6_9ACTN|nr:MULTISPECIES: hypothetical protein [unclassified Streptomyces]MYY06753.1 hypothetical protein [Streptomyces sp. SID4913]WLQ34439.1 hypothetical protein P8A18_13760 [Streptomyces sp. Mut1]
MADLKHITDALRAEAKMWDEQSDSMGQVAGAVQGMRMTRLEAGLFQMIVSSYSEAIDQISTRCLEGQVCMADVADALIKNANAYDNQEVDTTKSVEDAY